jgi:hypothetical protein
MVGKDRDMANRDIMMLMAHMAISSCLLGHVEKGQERWKPIFDIIENPVYCLNSGPSEPDSSSSIVLARVNH